MSPRDRRTPGMLSDLEFEKTRRRIAMQHRVLGITVVMVWAIVLIGAIWLIQHPEAIGSYAGRATHAFQVAK